MSDLPAQQIPVTEGPPAQLPGTPVTVSVPEPPSLIAWTIDLPAAPVVSPLITADLVIAVYQPGFVAAYARADGGERWRVELGADGPLVSDGTLVFVPSEGAVHALRLEDGSVAWRATTGELTAPMVTREGWLLAATDGKLAALRAADGATVWTVDAGLQRERAEISGNVLYASYADGRLIARDLTSGRVLWERRFRGVPGEPFVYGEDLFVGVTDKTFYCLNASTGRDDWLSKHVGATIRGRAAADARHVYFAALDNMVWALDRGHGAIRWHKGVPFRPSSGPVVAGRSVFVAGPGTSLAAFVAATGAPAASITFPGQLALTPGFLETEEGVVFAAVTGSLAKTWHLSLTHPLR